MTELVCREPLTDVSLWIRFWSLDVQSEWQMPLELVMESNNCDVRDIFVLENHLFNRFGRKSEKI